MENSDFELEEDDEDKDSENMADSGQAQKNTINRLQPMTRQKTRMDSNSPGIWDEIAGEKPFGLMGILNLTPDSLL